MSTSILILAAGRSPTEAAGGYPLSLTEIDGRSVLEHIVQRTRGIAAARHVFAILRSDADRFHLDKVAQLLAPGAQAVCVPEATKGSACTALLAASQLDPADELLVVSANELVDIDFGEALADFRQRSLDGAVLVFPSVHPRYSYVRVDETGMVVEAAQQDPISHMATAGVFWFARTGDFVEAAKGLIRKNAHVNGQFYVAPCFNELILKGRRIGTRELSPDHYHPLKDERQLAQTTKEWAR